MPVPFIIISFVFSPSTVRKVSSVAAALRIAEGAVHQPPPAPLTSADDQVRGRDRADVALGLEATVEGHQEQAAVGHPQREESAAERLLHGRRDQPQQHLARLEKGLEMRTDGRGEIGCHRRRYFNSGSSATATNSSER